MTNSLNMILGEGTDLTEDAKTAITEAWEAQLTEAKEGMRAELREEYAKKYEHDKGALAEATDKFITDKIRAELEEFAVDKNQLAEERVAYKTRIKEHTKKLDESISAILKKEITELRGDRSKMSEGFKKLENFILKQLSTEIQELREDRNALVEQKVKMVAEGKTELNNAKKAFVARAATVVKETIDRILRSEMTQFKDDIKEARENDFGRRIFEAYVAEYAISHLNEKSEIGKLRGQLKEAKDKLTKKVSVAEELQIDLNVAKDRIQRTTTLSGLMSSLSKEKKGIMTDLLESVETGKLEKAFGKYLPAVLNKPGSAETESAHTIINESDALTVETGDKVKNLSQVHADSDFDSDLAELKTLAGINIK